jgi:hypothetical protein
MLLLFPFPTYHLMGAGTFILPLLAVLRQGKVASFSRRSIGATAASLTQVLLEMRQVWLGAIIRLL